MMLTVREFVRRNEDKLLAEIEDLKVTMIHGLTCVGFESCGNYDLSDEIIGYAKAHLVKEAPVVDLRH